MPEGAQSWSLSLRDGFNLYNPSGNLVHLPYRKVEELFVALAKSGGEGLSRDYLCDLLWPDSNGDQRKLNLRQTLSRLRKAIGDSALIATRYHCNLASDFRVVIEGPGVELGDEPFRQGLKPTPMSGFMRMIEWSAHNDPSQMLEMMRAALDFTYAAPPTFMIKMLEVAIPKIPNGFHLKCWAPFWKGYMVMSSSNIREAQDYFSLAAEGAERRRDAILISECYFWWGASEILLGRSAQALRLAEKAQSLLASWGSLDRLYKINNLRGTALLHLNRNEEALKLFESVTGYGNLTTLDFANHEVLRALYLATNGQFAAAREVLEFPSRQAAETGLDNLNCLCRLANGFIEAHEEPLRAIDTLGSMAESAKTRKFSHLLIYAHESLAVAHAKMKNFDETKSHLTGAKALRGQLGMSYTAWDLRRLKPLTELQMVR